MALLPRLALGTGHRLSRHIFTPPDLSSLSPFSGGNGGGDPQPQIYHERKIFPYTQKQLYELVADATSYPRFLPFCTDARILRKFPEQPDQPGRRTMDVELTVGFMSFKESYVSKVTCRPYESVEAVAASATPIFKTLNTVWRFQPASAQSPLPAARFPWEGPQQGTSNATAATAPQQDGNARPTLVTLDLSFAFANPVHAAVSATVFGQVSKLMVKAFEERCLEIYGKGTA
ncbi:dehydrase and lipid transport-domain-containing protein [Trametes polyzona]|nr:dehydrase and lipid transport-domain-containing protein [Trametes polyzona]